MELQQVVETDAHRLFVHGFGEQMTPNRRTICSIVPCRLSVERPYDGRKRFTIPAAEEGKYVTLRVYDTQQAVMNYAVEPPSLEPRPITATSAADCIVNEMQKSLGRDNGGLLGVRLIAGDTPTEEEINDMVARQTTLAITLFNQAEGHHMERRYERIPNLARVLAKWMGVTAEWVPDMTRKQQKDCPACALKIEAAALRCVHCQIDLPKWYAANFVNTSQDPVIEAFLARMAEGRKAAGIASKAPPPVPQAAPRTVQQAVQHTAPQMNLEPPV